MILLRKEMGKFVKTSSECVGITTMTETTIDDRTSGNSSCKSGQVRESGGNPLKKRSEPLFGGNHFKPILLLRWQKF